MADQDKTPNPLDHATARIITELASALTAPLQETVSSELARTLKSMPVDIDREAGEVLSSLRRLKALADGMADTLSSAQGSAAALSDVWDKLAPLSGACETINSAAERLAKTPIEPQGGTPKTDELLRSLDAGLSDWTGVLKANGRAQTQELSDFSAEVAEQVGWIKSAMPGIVKESIEKTLSSRAEEWREISRESSGTLETRLTKLEKNGTILLMLWVAFLILLGMLYFK